MILTLLMAAASPMQCTPSDYLCNLGRAPTYSEQEAGRIAAQRAQAERELIERQAAATQAMSNSQAEAARAVPNEVRRLAADRRCEEAADTALRRGDIDRAQQSRAYCR